MISNIPQQLGQWILNFWEVIYKMDKLITSEDTFYVAGSTGMVGKSICKILKSDN